MNNENYLSVIQAVLQTWKGDLRVIADFTEFAERKNIVVPKDVAMQIIKAFSSVDAALFTEVSEGLYDLMQSVEEDDDDDRVYVTNDDEGATPDYVRDPFMLSIYRRLDCGE